MISQVKEENRENLNLKWACNKKGNLVQNMEQGTIHAKCVIVDNKYVITGSSLMDKQSQRSRETDILFESETRALEYQEKAFNPVFELGRPINIKCEVTRYEIQQTLKKVNNITELKSVISQYISLREYEDEYTGIRKIKGSMAFSRAKKVSAAQTLLDCIDNNQNIQDKNVLASLKEGLLGKIFKEFNEKFSADTTSYKERYQSIVQNKDDNDATPSDSLTV